MVMQISERLSKPIWTPSARGIVTPKSPYPIVQASPLNEAPPNSWPFLPNGSVVIPAIGSAAVICSEKVPQDKSGVIRFMANYSNVGPGISGWTPGDPTLLVWQLLRNGVPIQYFDDIVIAFGLTELGGAPLASPLRLRANDTISLIVNNIGLAPAGQWLVGLLSGYVFPARQDPSTAR
jgi:hypothetical protein